MAQPEVFKEKTKTPAKTLMIIGATPFALLLAYATMSAFGGITVPFFGNQKPSYGMDAFGFAFMFPLIFMWPIFVVAAAIFILGLVRYILDKCKGSKNGEHRVYYSEKGSKEKSNKVYYRKK